MYYITLNYQCAAMPQSNGCNRHRQFTLGPNQKEWNSKVQRLIDNAHREHETLKYKQSQGLYMWLYKLLNVAKKLMSKSTNRHSNSSKSVSCTSPSFPQWFDRKCPISPPRTLGTAHAHRGCLYAMRGAASDCFLPPTAVIVELWLTASEPLTDSLIGLHTQGSDPLPWIGRSTWKPL